MDTYRSLISTYGRIYSNSTHEASKAQESSIRQIGSKRTEKLHKVHLVQDSSR